MFAELNDCYSGGGESFSSACSGFKVNRGELGVNSTPEMLGGSTFIGTKFNFSGGLLYVGGSVYATTIADMEFINCDVNVGSLVYSYYVHRNISDRIIFRNCKINFVTAVTEYLDGLSSGTITFEHYNQVEGDHRKWHLNRCPAGLPTWTEYNDKVIYRSTAPSIKLEKGQSDNHPFIYPPIAVLVPKGAARRITAYMRKNSIYGGEVQGVSALPKMRVRHETGTLGWNTLTRHETEDVMTDVDDTWVQVRVEVTHDFNSPMWLEFELMTSNIGGIVWIDDITIEEI